MAAARHAHVHGHQRHGDGHEVVRHRQREKVRPGDARARQHALQPNVDGRRGGQDKPEEEGADEPGLRLVCRASGTESHCNHNILSRLNYAPLLAGLCLLPSASLLLGGRGNCPDSNEKGT